MVIICSIFKWFCHYSNLLNVYVKDSPHISLFQFVSKRSLAGGNFQFVARGRKVTFFSPCVKRDTCSRHLLYTHRIRNQQQQQQCNAFTSPPFQCREDIIHLRRRPLHDPAIIHKRYHSMTPLKEEWASPIFCVILACNDNCYFSWCYDIN